MTDLVRWEWSSSGRAYCTDYCLPAFRRSKRDTPCGVPPDEENPQPRCGPGPCPNQPPRLRPDNVRAWHAWSLVSDQWRVGMDVVGFDLPGAAIYLDRFGLADPGTLLKIRAIANVVLAEMRQRREDKRKR